MISKIRHQTCQISDFHTECYKGGGVRFTIWSQTSRAFYAVENREKLSNFTKTIIIRVVFPVLIFDSKLDILPKTCQGSTNYNNKISIKITHYQLL